MTSKLELDPRLDPRIKAFFAGMPLGHHRPPDRYAVVIVGGCQLIGARFASSSAFSP